MATQAMKCECRHDAQDKIYGKGNRLHNSGLKGWKCTVCEKTKGESVPKKEKQEVAKKK